MLPYLQAIRHVAVVTPIKNPNQVEQRHHGKDHPSHQRKRFFVHPKFRIERVRALQIGPLMRLPSEAVDQARPRKCANAAGIIPCLASSRIEFSATHSVSLDEKRCFSRGRVSSYRS
jgi:hypothetical protein